VNVATSQAYNQPSNTTVIYNTQTTNGNQGNSLSKNYQDLLFKMLGCMYSPSNFTSFDAAQEISTTITSPSLGATLLTIAGRNNGVGVDVYSNTQQSFNAILPVTDSSQRRILYTLYKQTLGKSHNLP
jgi:hypothetical protein